jgi:hypothetical protein
MGAPADQLALTTMPDLGSVGLTSGMVSGVSGYGNDPVPLTPMADFGPNVAPPLGETGIAPDMQRTLIPYNVTRGS